MDADTSAQGMLRAALAAFQAGALDRAAKLYEQVLLVEPQSFNALQQAATLETHRGRHCVSVALFSRAIQAAPWHSRGYVGLGVALRSMGHGDLARPCFLQALALDPDCVDAAFELGTLCLQQAELPTALDYFARALRRRPDHLAALINESVAWLKAGNPERALESCNRALAVDSGNAFACFGRGNALRQLARTDEAIADYRAALALAPGYVEAMRNLACTLQDAGQWDESILWHERAAAAAPKDADLWCNLAHALRLANRLGEACAAYRSALALEPDRPDAHFHLALSALAQGDFTSGWAAYEWRWKVFSGPEGKPVLPIPEWNGQAPLAGRTLLVLSEQGMGDTLQFSRFLCRVKAAGAQVVLAAPRPLVRLLQGLDGADQVVAKGDLAVQADCFCMLLSLPFLLGASERDIDGRAYLTSDPTERVAVRRRLGSRAPVRIGVAWSGNPIHVNDGNRSIPLAELQDVLVDGIEFVSLQPEVRSAERSLFERLRRVRTVLSAGDDFAVTAALIEEMDWVISVDTSVAHLAGALGKETWLLLPFAPDWRWQLDRRDSPWYESVRLFRQRRPGDWSSALREVRDALADRLQAMAVRDGMGQG